jgi:maltose alpha-D-glucosyltransferase/alpha-amylase
MRNLAVQNLTLLRRNLSRVPEPSRPQAEMVLRSDTQILRRLRAITERRILGKRIRCHGDFHLGQILSTGKDFVFIDFEGEPSRPLGERRIKRSPLRDVASMLRSFDYISQMALCKQLELGTLNQEDLPKVEPWTSLWRCWVSAAYLGAYLKVVAPVDLLPPAKDQLAVLLDSHLLEKALYELGYELHHRPDWLRIPLAGILRLLTPEAA